MTESLHTTASYRSTSLYTLLVSASVLASLLCAWSLWRQFDWITLLFLLGCLYAAFSYGVQWRSTVALDAHGFWLRTPLQTYRVEFRQLDGASEAGRIARRIVVTYHPLHDNGLLDLDDLRSVTFPAVDRQVELLTLLESKRLRSM